MATECTLYKFEGDSSCVDKTLTQVVDLGAIAPYRPVNDLDGTIIVSASAQSANYCRLLIGGKTKYYYIESRSVDTGGRMHLFLHEDVLMTHATWIKGQSAMLSRSYAYGNDYLNAGYPMLSYNKISHHSATGFTYGTNLTAPPFVLVTAGRGYKATNIKDSMTTQIPVN